MADAPDTFSFEDAQTPLPPDDNDQTGTTNNTFSFEDAQQPQAQAPTNTFSFEDASTPDDNAPKPSVSLPGAAAVGAVKGTAPSIGAIAGGMYGAGIGETAWPAGGALVGGVAGAVIGSGLVTKAQQWFMDKLGLDQGDGFLSNAYEEAAHQQHPIAYEAGNLAPMVAGFEANGATAVSRALSAAIMGGGQAAQEYFETGSVNPYDVGAAAIAGGAMGAPREWASAAQAAGRTVGEGLRARVAATAKGTGTGAIVDQQATPENTTVRPDLNNPTPARIEDKTAADDATVPPNVAFGTSEVKPAPLGANEPAPAPGQADTTEAATISVVRGARDEGKNSTPASREGITNAISAPGLQVDPIDMTVKAAMDGLTADNAPAPAPAPTPALPPTPEPATPGPPAPLPTGLQQAAAGQPQPAAPPTAAPLPPPMTIDQAVQRALQRPIVTDHPIVSGAISSADPNGPIYVDPSVPPQLQRLVAIHEGIEDMLERMGVKNTQAHTVATQGEKMAVEKAGIDWKQYSDWWSDNLPRIEQQKVDPALYKSLNLASDPYADIGKHVYGDNPLPANEPATPAQQVNEKAVLDRVRANGYGSVADKIETMPPITRAQAIQHANDMYPEGYTPSPPKAIAPVAEPTTAQTAIPSLQDQIASYKNKPQPTGAAATPAKRAALVGDLRGAWENFKNAPMWFENPIRKIFSPQSVSVNAEEAAAAARETHGQRLQFNAQNIDALATAQQVMNKASAQDTNNYLLNFENNTVPEGNPLSVIQPDVKAVLDRYKDKLAALPAADKIGFIDNYFPRSGLWAKDDANAAAIRNFLTEQGSTTALKHRVFPTIPEALAAGIKLNPDMVRPDGAPDMMKVLGTYMNQMGTYVETQNMLKNYIQRGIAHTYEPGEGIPPGEVALEGRTYLGRPVFAPADVATIYNNFWSPGIHANQPVGQLYDAWLHGKNSMSMLTLLGGSYHMAAIGTESVLSNAATGIAQMASGDINKGIETLTKAPGAPYTAFRLGQRGQEGYLNPSLHPDLQPDIKALTDAGFTFSPHQAIAESAEFQYAGSAASNFFDAFHSGRLSLDAAEAAQRIRSAAGQNIIKGGLQVGKEAFGIVGKTMQTIARPLFGYYIPLVKNGAALQNMAAWHAANPDASPEELTAVARKIADSIDNRLGIVHQSNVFWNKTLKQAAQASMLSWSWNFGTVREIAGGALKIARNPGSVSIKSPNYDPRSSYVIAMPIVTTVMAAIYQMLKTGKMPQEPPQNIGEAFTGQTGGLAARSGESERAILPGYQKDVLGAWNSIINPSGTGKASQELYGKLAPAVHLGIETLTNQDWAGHPIWNPNDPMSQKLLEYFQHVGQSLAPITLQQTTTQSRKGTNISTPERLMGIRPAPTWIEKSNETVAGARLRNQRAWQAKKIFDLKQAQ